MPDTTRGITYPDSGGHTRLWEHLQELANDTDAALDKVLKVVTSATRPSHIEGRLIYETDTDTLLVSDGAAWRAVQVGSPWTGVTFANSWADYGAGFQTVQYRKVGDEVQIRGVMKSGAVGATAFNLPVGYRPPATLMCVTVSNQTVASRFDIGSDGNLVPIAVNNAYVVVNFTFSVL